ncbi:MAG: branched-chain amino acid ABC transporter permease [Roseiflexaceae bacterium]|nr:branched-chain amino acid ABC transporter permease [Roseiflexus sp.]MDW8212861.1 branched-chain amino acid ABC transporter permease [Roseiflexaceae bacterium]
MDWVGTIVQGLLLGGFYALYGIGLSLIFGVMRLVNLAHGDLIVCAAYLSLVLIEVSGLPPLLTLAIVIPVMFGLGVLLQRGVLNRVLGLGPMPPLLITFGISIIIQNGLLLAFTADTQRLPAGSLETASVPVGGWATVGVLPLLNMAIAILAIIGLQQFMGRTDLGRAFRATSDDPTTAELMGIDSKRIYGLAMGASLALIAVAGILLGMRTTFGPSDGPARLIYAFEAVIIGGLGSLWGTLAGGLLLGVAQSVGAALNPGWFQLAGHILALLVLAIRPTGLFARTRDL